MQRKQKVKTIGMQLKSAWGLPLWLQWLVNRIRHTTSSPFPFCGIFSDVPLGKRRKWSH